MVHAADQLYPFLRWGADKYGLIIVGSGDTLYCYARLMHHGYSTQRLIEEVLSEI